MELEQLSKPTLLNVPRHVKLRIYIRAGALIHPGLVYFINLNSNRAPHLVSWYDPVARPFFVTTHSLLLTCRTTYNDLCRLVYSRHHFFIRPDGDHSLQAVHRLSTEALRGLRLLTLHLNVSSCGLGDLCRGRMRPWERHLQRYDKHDASLRLGEERAQNLIKQWHHFIDMNSGSGMLGQRRLQLNFICDVADYATRWEVLRPLNEDSRLLLANCSIRLCCKVDPGFEELAKTTVIAVTSSEPAMEPRPSPSPSYLLRLPSELRYHILSFTDLVTPFREVEWHPKYGMYLRYENRQFAPRATPTELHGEPDHQAQQIAPDRWRWRKHWPAYHDRASTCFEMSFPCGCFCKAYHSAHSTIRHCSCTCWAPPKALFLVCRALREDASQVFFNLNRLIITATGIETWAGVDQPPDHLPGSLFLTSLIFRDVLQHLRFLEVVVPPFAVQKRCSYCPSGSRQWQDWVRTIERIKEHLDLSKLTIRISFAGWLPEEGDDIIPPTPTYRKVLDATESRLIEETYMNIVKPLRSLQGLHRFFAEFANPRYRTFETRNEGRKHFDFLEDEAEKFVMGESYDAIAAGKPRFQEVVGNEIGSSRTLGVVVLMFATQTRRNPNGQATSRHPYDDRKILGRRTRYRHPPDGSHN